MPTGDDFRDETPTPNPTPKRRFVWPDPSSQVTGVMAWSSGQTFAQLLNASLPPALKSHTIPADASVKVTIIVEEQ